MHDRDISRQHLVAQRREIEAGRLRDKHYGRDPLTGWRYEDHSVNKGMHVIHTGENYDSYLQVPVIPAEHRSARSRGAKKITIT